MAACSVGFIGAVVVGAKAGMGEVGLIYANCLNMTLRIAFSSFFIRRFYSGASAEIRSSLNWRRWTPKLVTLMVFVVSSVVVRWSEAREWKSVRGMGRHLLVGAGCGLACLGVM